MIMWREMQRSEVRGDWERLDRRLENAIWGEDPATWIRGFRLKREESRSIALALLGMGVWLGNRVLGFLRCFHSMKIPIPITAITTATITVLVWKVLAMVEGVLVLIDQALVGNSQLQGLMSWNWCQMQMWMRRCLRPPSMVPSCWLLKKSWWIVMWDLQLMLLNLVVWWNLIPRMFLVRPIGKRVSRSCRNGAMCGASWG